jgi:outer membrane protein assembly factor BamB
MRPDRTKGSPNWSGYAVTGSSFTDAKGSWIVPSVNCSETPNARAAFWVGIDGENSSTVEQIGTESVCDSGTASYFAWYEFFPPNPLRRIKGFPVKPNDKIYVDVSYNGSEFTVTIQNGKGTPFSCSEKGNGQPRSSAEWIAEASCLHVSNGRCLEFAPLTDFGTAGFGYDYTGVSNTNTATDANHKHAPISAFGSAVTKITMDNPNGVDEAAPSNLTSDGKSFTVAWTVSDWSEFHATNMGRRNPHEKALDVNNVGNLSLKWSYTTGGWDSSPAVANGVVYVGSGDDNVYALDANTGAKLWSYLTDSLVNSSPAVANGVVYVGSLDGNVYALNASTGAKLWTYTTGGVVTSDPAVANGVVYVGSYDGNLYALNAKTGAKLWSYTTGDYVESSPAVANGVVYVGSDDDNVYALNASTGALLWSYDTGHYGNLVRSSPAVANGVVYVGSDDDNVYALNASTGALLWSYTTGGYVDSSPAVANGVVYVGSHDGNLYALNASTGALLWSYPTGGDSSPAVASGVVYVGSHDEYAFGLKKVRQ